MLIPFDKDSRFIVLSDCHRGNGTAGDEFCSAEGCRSYPLAITRTVLEDG